MQKNMAVRMLFIFGMIVLSVIVMAQELQPIQLPAPQMEGGRPLMQVLKDRKTIRSFEAKELSDQTLSNLLWAAFGINRSESGRRTAPSAVNWQEIDIYVALKKGLYLYDVKANQLKPVVDQDLRTATGMQEFVGEAPLNLVFVADYSKMGEAPDEFKDPMAYADAGFIGQNVYLFCASEGLGTVVRAMIDRKTLAPLMQLGEDQRIILAQTVGYPKQSTE
ncbi:nitroreductase family protein [bacterium]